MAPSNRPATYPEGSATEPIYPGGAAVLMVAVRADNDVIGKGFSRRRRPSLARRRRRRLCCTPTDMQAVVGQMHALPPSR